MTVNLQDVPINPKVRSFLNPIVLLVVIVTIGAALRLYALGARSLSVDEIRRVTEATRQDLGWLWRNRSFQLPTYLITRLFASLFGRTEAAVRFPSALAGILGILMVYKVAEDWFGWEEGVLAAWLLTISPVHFRWSRDEAFYALMVLLSLLSLYSLQQALQKQQARWWAGFALTTILNVYNHTYAWSVAASEFLFAGLVLLSRQWTAWQDGSLSVFQRIRRLALTWSPLIVVAAVVGLAYLPVVPIFLNGWAFDPVADLQVRTFFEERVQPSDPGFYAELLAAFGAGKGFALGVFGVAFLVGLIASRPKLVLLALLWMITPFVLIILVHPRYFYDRFVLFILPVYLIFIARGLTNIGRLSLYISGLKSLIPRGGSVFSLAIAILLFGGLSLSPLQKEWVRNENWRDIAAFLQSNVRRGEIIIVEPAFGKDRLLYYQPQLRSRVQSASGSLQRFRKLHARYRGTWFVRLECKRFLDPEQRIETWVTAEHFMPIIRHQTINLWYKSRVKQTSERFLENKAKLLEEAVETFPPAPEFHLDLGSIYKAQGKWSQASAQFRQAIELRPDNARAHIFLADTYRATGSIDLALAEYDRAAELNPQYVYQAWYHIKLGYTYMKSNRLPEAITHFEYAILLDPDNANAHRGLAQAYEKSGQEDRAATHWEEYKRLIATEGHE